MTTLKKMKKPKEPGGGFGLRKLVMLAIGIIAVFIASDIGLGAAMGSDHPSIERTKGDKNGTAIVVFGSMQASTKALIAPHLKLLRGYGDVVTVEYSQTGLDGNTVVVDTWKKLQEWGYKKTVLLGVSLGGDLATDLIDYDRANGHKLQFSVIAADAPTEMSDIENKLGLQIMSRWYAGKLSDWIFTPVIWWATFEPPAEKDLGKGVNKKLLDAHYDVSRHYPMSGWTDELRYVRDHVGYRPDTYKTIPLVVLQSEHDDVVKKEAASKWKLAFGGGTVLTIKNSRHAGLVEWPREWDAGLEQALDRVA